MFDIKLKELVQVNDKKINQNDNKINEFQILNQVDLKEDEMEFYTPE